MGQALIIEGEEDESTITGVEPDTVPVLNPKACIKLLATGTRTITAHPKRGAGYILVRSALVNLAGRTFDMHIELHCQVNGVVGTPKLKVDADTKTVLRALPSAIISRIAS